MRATSRVMMATAMLMATLVGPAPTLAQPSGGSGDGSWTQLNPNGPSPSPRTADSAVWDEADGEMLVFGGEEFDSAHDQDSFKYHNDLWSYRPASNSWTHFNPSGSLPSARDSHSAVWDAADGQMLVFGGGECC